MQIIRGNLLKARNSLSVMLSALFAIGGIVSYRADAIEIGGDSLSVITLEDAWNLAARYNKDLRIAREQVIVADGRVREAWSGALPNVSAMGQYQRNIETPVFYITMSDPNTGNEVTQAFKIGEANAYTGILQVQQPLWLAGKIGLGLKAARLYRNLSQESLRSEGITLRYQVASDFFGVLLARSLLSVARENYELAVKHSSRVHDLFDQGQVSEYDVIRADVQTANLQPGVMQAENQMRLAEDALKSRLGLDLSAGAEFQGELVPIERQFPETADAYLEALRNRPEQQIIDLQKRLNSIQYKAESRNVYWPNLYLSGNVTWQSQAPDFQIEDYQWNRSVSALLQVSIPLFDGFRTSARKQQVQAAGHQLSHQEVQFHDGLRLELQGILDNIKTANQRLDAEEKTIEQAERGLRIAEVRYENGISTLLEILDAQLALSIAKTEYLKSVYDQRVAIFALERALGQFGLTPDETEE